VAVAITNPGGAIAGQAASGNVATYSSVDIGEAAADRIVAICVGTELTNSGPTACTIDFGGGDVAMVAGSLGTQGAVNARIFYLRVPTGTTATIKVTFGATNPTADEARIGALRIVGADVRLVSEGQVADTDADPITTAAITVPTNGGKLVSYAAAATTARTWTGVTEDLDVNATNFRFSTGFLNGSGSITTTVSGGNNEDAALSYIVLMESPTPTPPISREVPAAFTRKTLTAAAMAAGCFWVPFVAPPVGDGSVAWAAAQATVPYHRTVLYPSLQEPVPFYTGDGTVEFSTIENDLPFYGKTLLYPSLQEPTPFVVAEEVTLDKYHQPWSEPVRRIVDVVNLPASFPNPFPITVEEYRWHVPLSEPTRRIPTVYPQSELNDPFPRVVVDEYAWFRPLSEPTHWRGLLPALQQTLAPDPYPRTVEEYAWRPPLSEPTRRKPTVYPQSELNDPYPRPIVDEYRWHVPFSEPTRWRGLLPALQQAVAPDPYPRVVVDEYAWYRPLSEPTLRKPNVYPDLAYSYFVEVQELVTLDKWFHAWREPTQRKVDVSSYPYLAWQSYPITVADYAWFRPLSEPTLRIPTVYPQSGLEDPFPRVSFSWFQALNEPTRRKPTVYPQSELNDPFPRTVADYAWYQPLSEPTRRKATVHPSALSFDPFPQISIGWHQALSEPVLPKPKQYEYVFASYYPVDAEIVTLDKWYQALSEPTRRPRVVAEHRALAFDPFPRTVEEYAWRPPLSEPTRRKPTVHPTALSWGYFTPAPELVTLDKWFQEFSQPTRLRTVAYQLDLSWGIFTPEPVPDDETSNVWQKRPRRHVGIHGCTPGYCVKMRVAVSTKLTLPDAAPPPPVLVSVQGRYDAPYFVRIELNVDWPEEDRSAIGFLLDVDRNEAVTPGYRARLKLLVETDAEHQVDDFLAALDAMEDRPTKRAATTSKTTVAEPEDDSLAISWLQDWLNAD
jgi:hypothetical protein